MSFSDIKVNSNQTFASAKKKNRNDGSPHYFIPGLTNIDIFRFIDRSVNKKAHVSEGGNGKVFGERCFFSPNSMEVISSTP